MNATEPQLEHNRAEEGRLVRRKRQMLLALMIVSVPILLIVPPGAAPATSLVLLGSFGGGVLFIEVKRFRLLQRDLRERRQLGEGREREQPLRSPGGFDRHPCVPVHRTRARLCFAA